jgi:predicted nucleotidyltransferase
MVIGKSHIEKATEICKKYGVTRLILFGSAVQRLEESRDLDFAIDGIDDWKFFELGGVLENELMIPIDLVPLNPPNRFTKMIEKTGIVLL